MGEAYHFPLPVVDGLRLDKALRDVLLPDRHIHDESGAMRRLPRYFFEIASWEHAMSVRLSPNFGLWEFIQTDVREAAALRAFPRYVPCAITLLALCLERFRDATGTFVHIAANGGYRSPRHAINTNATPHCWGSAANIYRIGDTLLDTPDTIRRYATLVHDVIPTAWTRPLGDERMMTDDHLHVDLGYVISIPREAPGETYNLKLAGDPL